MCICFYYSHVFLKIVVICSTNIQVIVVVVFTFKECFILIHALVSVYAVD